MDEENVILKSFSENELKELITDSSSHVRLVRNVHHIALPPSSLGNLKAAIKRTLDAMLHRYNAKFGGFLMGYKNIKVDQKVGSLINDDSSVHLDIEADFYIFTPEVGGILHGIVNTKSPDHIGCLVHSIFNVSILRPTSESDTNWKGTSVEIGDEVTLCMKLCDFSGSLPYMQGSIISSRPRPQEDATTTDKSPTKKKKKKHKDTDEKESKQVDDIIVPEHVFQHGKRKREEEEDDEIDGAKKKKKKRKREEKDVPSESSQYSNVIKQELDLHLNVQSDQSSNEKLTEKEHKKHKKRRLDSFENGSGELEGNSDKDNKEEEVETVPRLAESKLKKKKHGKDREKIVVKEEETKVPEEIEKNTLVGGLDFSSLLARFNTTNNEKKANKTDKMSVSVNEAENKASEPFIPDIKHLLNEAKDIIDDKSVKKEKDRSDTDRKEKKKKKKDASESKSIEKDDDEIDGGKKKKKRKRDKKDKTAETLVVPLEHSQYSNKKKQEQDSYTNVKSSQSSDEKPKEKDKKKHKSDSFKNESSESEGNASKSSKEGESEDDQGVFENKSKEKKRGKDTEKEEETKVPEGVKKDIMAGELDFSSMLARFNANTKEKNRISSSLNKAEKKDLESLLPGIIPLLNKEKDVDGKKPEKKKKEKDKSNTNKKEKKKNESKQNSETLPKETDLQRVTTNDSDDDYFPVTPHTSKDSSRKVKGRSKKEKKKEKDTSKSKQSSEIGLQSVTRSESDDDYFPVTPHTSNVMPHEDSSDSDEGKPKGQEKKSQDVSSSDSSDKEETDKIPSKQEKKSQDVSGNDSSDKEETAKNPSKSKFQLNMMDPSSPFSLLKASTANWLDQNRISKTGEASPVKKTLPLFMPSSYQQSTPLESNLPATMSQFLKEFSPPYTTDSQGSGKSKKSSPQKSIKAEKGTTKPPKETKKRRSSPSKNFQLPSSPFKTNFKFFEDSEKTSKDNSLNVSGFEAPDLTKALQILASPPVNKDTPRKRVTFSPSKKSATPKSESKSALPKSPKSAEVKKSSKDKTKTKDKKKDKHKTKKKDKHKEKGEKKHKEKGEKKHKKKDKGEKKKDKEKKTDEVQKRVEEMLKKMLNKNK